MERTQALVAESEGGTMKLPSRIAGLVVALLLSSTGIGFAQIVDTRFWVTNGHVGTIVADGGKIYIGGSFTHCGARHGRRR
jgi:hypothetical protein